MYRTFLMISLLISVSSHSQELYVFSEPASNMPAHSISAKLTAHINPNVKIFSRAGQRYMPEIMFGVSKKTMVHIGGTFSNMNTSDFRPESVFIYGKYRFYANDEVHEHFRMAAFVNASYTHVPFHLDEADLMGDKSGIAVGLIATQLYHRFAVSGTLSHVQLLDKSRFDDVVYLPKRVYQAMNYSLSAGFLLLPKEYTDYRQTNVNLYLELLGERALGQSKYYVDLAPACQFIFNSNAKLNIGYRFQLGSNMQRMATETWLISFERTFLR